jgi:hypothetical protein
MKKIIGLGITTLVLICLGYLMYSWIAYENKPLVYLIPEGTKGWCHIVWENPNASPPIETKNERIIQFNKTGIVHTSFYLDKEYIVEYYYFDKNGKRTRIFNLPLEERINDFSKETIFLCGDGLFRIGEGPGGPFYPGVTQFFLGTRAEIDEEFARIEREEDYNFPPYPEDALKLKRSIFMNFDFHELLQN